VTIQRRALVKRLVYMVAMFIVSAATWGATSDYGGDNAAQDIWLLENGSPETWVPAMRRLMKERYLRKKAVASVLRRMDVLRGPDRIALCGALGTAWRDPRALDALLKLARDPEPDIRRAARVSLSEQVRHLSPDILLQLAAEAVNILFEKITLLNVLGTPGAFQQELGCDHPAPVSHQFKQEGAFVRRQVNPHIMSENFPGADIDRHSVAQ